MNLRMNIRRNKNVRVVSIEGIFLVGVCAVATIIFLVKAASVSKQKNLRFSFWSALGFAFCFALYESFMHVNCFYSSDKLTKKSLKRR